jgi:hypothetical protein
MARQPRNSDSPPVKKPTPPLTQQLGKPAWKTFSTPDLRDRVIVVRRDLRTDRFDIPAQGSPFVGVDKKDRADGYVFATVVSVDPPGTYLDLYYLRTREDQDRYNMVIDYPYVDRNYPRLTRTYILLRADELATAEPQADTTDTVLTNLKLTDHKIVRIEDDPVLDSLFVKVVRIFERLPGPIITSYDTNQFQQQVTVRTQEIEKGPSPKLSALVEKASQERTGTAKAKNTAASVPEVFPNSQFEAEIPYVPHEEFLAGFESQTETQRQAGQAAMPVLSTGEFGKEEKQDTEFVKTVQTRRQPLPQERTHKETTELFGGGIAEEIIRVDTPSSGIDIEEGFTILESKLRDLGDFGLVRSTNRITVEASHIDVLTAGKGFTGPPAVTFVDENGSANAHGAVANAVMGRGVQNVVITNGGGSYDFPPAVRFRHADLDTQVVQPAIGVAQLSFGVGQVFINRPGLGYSVPPTVVFSGGQGSGAAGTAVIGHPINTISISPAHMGLGYTNPIVIITGDGTGARAVVKASDLAPDGHIKAIHLLSNGNGYSVAPTITILDDGGPGFGAQATSILKTGQGQITRVDLTNSGDYITPPLVSFSGASTAPAAATAFLGQGSGKVKSVSIMDPGRGYTQPPIVEFYGGSSNPNVAQATGYAVLEATYHVARIDLVTPGGFDPGGVAPIVVFSPNPTSLASAEYVIGGWPILYGSVIDSRYGLVTQIIKRVVPAGTMWRPGLGYTEVHSHDKWRSIMVTSKPDLRSLPPPVVYPTTRNIALPSHLEALYPSWAQTVGHSRHSDVATGTGQLLGETLKVQASVTGDITTQATRGYAGPALALVTEMFFFGPPSIDALPKPLKILGVYGTATLFLESHTKSESRNTLNVLIGDSDNSTTHTMTKTIGPVLTGQFVKNFDLGATAVAVGYGYGSPSDLNPTRGFDGTLIYPQGWIYLAPNNLEIEAHASMNIAIPVSDPPEMVPGMSYLEALQVDRLGLNIWKVALITVYVP